MPLADTLTALIRAEIRCSLSRSQSVGDFSGQDKYDHLVAQTVANGSGNGQASGAFTSELTITTGGITVSLADSADPLGAAGDDVPSSDPEALKLRAILVENRDTTNFITIAPGSNGLTSWIGGTNPTVRVPALGLQLATFPNGLDVMNDTSDDELLFTADTASVVIRLTYIYG